MLHAALAAALTLVPVHGDIVQSASASAAIARTDAVPGMLPSAIRRYRIEPPRRLAPGTGFDALLDRSTQPWALRNVEPAGPFSPGLPQPGRVVPAELGSPLPVAQLVDQDGRSVRLDRDFAGKTVLLSFIFTRCPDRTLCPAISGKYAYMQTQLDPADFALVEITLDPPYDSPAVLRQYGDRYGAKADSWRLLTGTGSTIQRLLDVFRISSMRVSSSNYIHNDKLFVVTPQGRIGYVAQTGGWDPQAAIAEAREIAGLANNPFERFKLSLTASVVALCGGSQFAGIVLLELSLFALIVVLVAAALWWVARVLWARP